MWITIMANSFDRTCRFVIIPKKISGGHSAIP